MVKQRPAAERAAIAMMHASAPMVSPGEPPLKEVVAALKVELSNAVEREIRMSFRAQAAERDRDEWRTRYNDLRLATDQVIINLNSCTALMRQHPHGGTPDRHWLTNQVNILRAAIVPKPYPIVDSVPHPCEGHGCGGTSMFMLHTESCVVNQKDQS